MAIEVQGRGTNILRDARTSLETITVGTICRKSEHNSRERVRFFLSFFPESRTMFRSRERYPRRTNFEWKRWDERGNVRSSILPPRTTSKRRMHIKRVVTVQGLCIRGSFSPRLRIRHLRRINGVGCSERIERDGGIRAPTRRKGAFPLSCVRSNDNGVACYAPYDPLAQLITKIGRGVPPRFTRGKGNSSDR